MEQTSVVGVAAVSGYGWGLGPLLAGLASGTSAVRLVPGRISGADDGWYARLPEREANDPLTSRFGQAIDFVVNEAVRDAEERGWRRGSRVGLVLATARGEIEGHSATPGAPAASPSQRYLTRLSSTPLLAVAARHGLHGPCLTVNGACAAGLQGILIAQGLLALGAVDDVIVAAADVGIDAATVAGLAGLGTLRFGADATSACRPFHAASSGFALGEGAAALVLTTPPGTGVLVRGVASANEAHHVTSLEPSGRYLDDLVARALAAAGRNWEDIDLLFAHASGTQQCSAAERRLLDRLKPGAGVVATKPMLGHARGAGSLLDSVLATHTLRGGGLVLESPLLDGDQRLARGDVGGATTTILQLAMGFGGNLAALVLERESHGG